MGNGQDAFEDTEMKPEAMATDADQANHEKPSKHLRQRSGG